VEMSSTLWHVDITGSMNRKGARHVTIRGGRIATYRITPAFHHGVTVRTRVSTAEYEEMQFVQFVVPGVAAKKTGSLR